MLNFFQARLSFPIILNHRNHLVPHTLPQLSCNALQKKRLYSPVSFSIFSQYLIITVIASVEVHYSLGIWSFSTASFDLEGPRVRHVLTHKQIMHAQTGVLPEVKGHHCAQSRYGKSGVLTEILHSKPPPVMREKPVVQSFLSLPPSTFLLQVISVQRTHAVDSMPIMLLWFSFITGIKCPQVNPHSLVPNDLPLLFGQYDRSSARRGTTGIAPFCVSISLPLPLGLSAWWARGLERST